MTRIFTLIFLLSFTASKAQIFIEDFNYSTGQLTATSSGANVSGGAWTQAGTNAASPIQVISGNLSYTGYNTAPAAGSGKMALTNFPTSGLEDITRQFPSSVNAGSVYAAMIFKQSSDSVVVLPGNATASPSNYFMGFSPYANATTYTVRVYLRQGSVAGTINFGLSYSSGTISWTGDYSAAVNHLVVFSYDFVTGASNDVVKLWIDPATPFSTQPPATLSITNSGSDATDIGRLFFRQSDRTTPVSEIDAITVASSWNTALFMHLISFDAKAAGEKINLAWQTGSEQNASHFELEYSPDAQNFQTITTVNATNEATGHRYTYSDPVRGSNSFYRLKMVDLDGQYVYSKMISILKPVSETVKAGPVPAKNRLNIMHNFSFEHASLNVFTLDGRKVLSREVAAGTTATELDITALYGGQYYAVFSADGKTQMIRFIKY